MLEDRRHDRPNLMSARDVELLQSVLGCRIGRTGDEVAPELVHKEARMIWMRHGEPHRVLPRVRAAVLEDRLRARIVVARVVTEVRRPDPAPPVVPEAGQGACLLA